MSSLHILSFCLQNSHAFRFGADAPLPYTIRLLFDWWSRSIHKLDLSEFSGHTILITGSTSGCGLDCARALSRVGCHLILTARNRERGEKLRQQVQKEADDADAKTVIDIVELDLTSFQSVKSLPSRLRNLGVTEIDIAILNAAVYQTNYAVCPRPAGRKPSSRLLLVSSEAHAWADPLQDSTQELLEELTKPEPSPYPCYQRYHVGKLLLNLWTTEISKRQEWDGISVAAVSPGYTRSGLFRDFNGLTIANALEAMCCRKIEVGAAEYIYALKEMSLGNGNGRFWSEGKWKKDSATVKCSRGQSLQSTVYTDLMSILTSAGVFGNN